MKKENCKCPTTLAHHKGYADEMHLKIGHYFWSLLIFAEDIGLSMHDSNQVLYDQMKQEYRLIVRQLTGVDDSLRSSVIGDFGLRKILVTLEENLSLVLQLLAARQLSYLLFSLPHDADIRLTALTINDAVIGEFASLPKLTQHLGRIRDGMAVWNDIITRSACSSKVKRMRCTISSLLAVDMLNSAFNEQINTLDNVLMEFCQQWRHKYSSFRRLQSVCLIFITIVLIIALLTFQRFGGLFRNVSSLTVLQSSPAIYYSKTFLLYYLLSPLFFVFYLLLLSSLTSVKVHALNQIDLYLVRRSMLKEGFERVKQYTMKRV